MNPEVTDLHQQFADALAARIAQVSDQEAQAAQVADQNQTPPAHETAEVEPDAGGFVGTMHEAAKKFTYYGLDDETGEYVTYGWRGVYTDDTDAFGLRVRDVIFEAVDYSKLQDNLLEQRDDLRGKDLMLFHAALSGARKELAKHDEPLARLKAIMVQGFVAAYYKPEDPVKAANPKKHKHETPEESLYRTALRDLKNTQDKVYNSRLRKIRSAYINSLSYVADDDASRKNELMKEALSHPDGDALRQADIEFELGEVVYSLLTAIQSDEVTAEDFRDQLNRIIGDMPEQSDENDEPELETHETNWTILPPGTLEELEGGTSGGSEGGGEGGETPTFVDPERMKWLARLAMSWGPDAYIAVANLDKSGNYDYRVAVLPQEQNGLVVEHAVAENPSSGNAIFAFRAENGVDDAGAWLTWKHVFHETKRTAKALGARRILHSKYTDDNVLEYLTRSPDELDKPGYRR